MRKVATYINHYNVDLRQEQAHIVKMKPSENGAPPEPELNEDGTPVIEVATLDTLVFTDGDSGDEYIFFADGDFRAEVIGVCAMRMTDEQKRRAAARLTGGIVVAGPGDLPAGGMNREQRRSRSR